jgi:hypothetical protein
VSDLMRRLTSRPAWARARRAGSQLWLRLKQASTCRQCDRPVNPLANICQHCGTGNPVKVGVSPHLLLTAVACEVVLLALNLRLG